MKILRNCLTPILIGLLFITLVGCKTAIPNDPPIASLKANTDRGAYPLDVIFDISNSFDPNGEIAIFELDFGDDTSPMVGSNGDISEAITHTYQKEGEFTVILSVTDDEGETKQVSVTIMVTTPPNQSPQVTITSPLHWSSFEHGATVIFSGTAEDLEDGTLSGTSLVWTSSLDGKLGKGEDFSRNDLSGGSHRIYLTATDSEGAETTAKIQIWVDPKPRYCVSE